jgi:type I restriction enzyme S subunit
MQRPYLRTKNVFDGRIDIDDVLTMPMTDEQFAKFRIRNGDVLLNEGQTIELVGRCAIYQDEYPEPCAIQNALLRFRARAGVSDKFASYLFRYCQHTGIFSRIALQTTSVAHLGGSRFEKLCLAWPTEVEQRAIATALSDVDGLLDGLDRLIAKKRDLKQAAMQQLLTGQTRLPGFHCEWEVKRLGDLFSFKNGLNKGKEFFGYGTPIVNYMDVFGNTGILCSKLKGRVSLTQQEIKNFNVRKGDVLFTRTSETPEEIGMASVILDDPSETVFSGFVLRGRPKNDMLCDAFKAYCFRAPLVRNQIISKASYTTRALTNGGILSVVSLSVPTKAEQIAIAEVLSDMDEELAALGLRRDKTRTLKQGMMQELLTGRTRLV